MKSIAGRFGGYENIYEPGNFDGLSAETEWRILEDYAEYRNANPSTPGGKEITADSIYISGYCGTYNGTVVLVLGDYGGPRPGVLYVYYIAGISFYGPEPPAFIIWNKGLFNGELEVAYNSGLLTQDDIRSIADCFGGHKEFDGYEYEEEIL